MCLEKILGIKGARDVMLSLALSLVGSLAREDISQFSLADCLFTREREGEGADAKGVCV